MVSGSRTGSALRSGAPQAARRLLAEPARDDRERALRQVAVGRLLREDGLRGLSHPTDPRLLRPGLGGSVVGVVVAGLFTAVPVVALTSMGVGPFAAEGAGSEQGAVDPGGPFAGMAEDPLGDPGLGDVPDPLVWFMAGFAVLGALLLCAAVASLVVRLRSVLLGRRLERQGRRALAGLPGGDVTAGSGGAAGVAGVEAATEAAYPRFAGMLSWTLPRRSTGMHDHDPF